MLTSLKEMGARFWPKAELAGSKAEAGAYLPANGLEEAMGMGTSGSVAGAICSDPCAGAELCGRSGAGRAAQARAAMSSIGEGAKARFWLRTGADACLRAVRLKSGASGGEGTMGDLRLSEHSLS